MQLANSVCETHVEQKITRLELHEKLGYKAYGVWKIKKFSDVFFMFMVFLELFEHVRSFFGVRYTLRCRVRVLEYDLSRAVCNRPIGLLQTDRTI